jgi:carboxypeptidase Taq
MSALVKLDTLLGEVMDLRHAADLIEWDERVYMPDGGVAVHGEMSATLRRLAHERFTSRDVAAAIEAATREAAGEHPDSDAARRLRVTARDYDKATRVPADFVAEHATVVSTAQHAWAQARATSDFALFRPHLQQVIDLKKRYVAFFPSADHPYDVLLDDFEPGLKTTEVRRLFDALRPRQVALIQSTAGREARSGVAAAGHDASSDGFLQAACAEAELWTFAVDVITAFGFDWTRGRQDKSAHPFATAMGSDDVRITTRWVEGQPLSLLFGTMHEAGHAMYEQGVSAAHRRTLLEGGASLGVHESQSRLWENLVGRSRSFWDHFFPLLQARCPSQLGSVSTEQFYRAVNRVRPSLIRVEADEATYNLHVMLRVELELAVIEGTIEVGDLPDEWNARMQQYLGLTPPDAASGVLQDIHWSAGLFGYFATYTLGNVIAAQLWDRFDAVRPSRDADIARGEFAPLLTWLRSELHQHGRKFEPQELVARITGSPVDPEPYLRYLETKYRSANT